jgi:hypothetical protein
MTTPDPTHTLTKPFTVANSVTDFSPDKYEIAAKAKEHNIRVSPAVLDAARKDGDTLPQSLHTTSARNIQSVWRRLDRWNLCIASVAGDRRTLFAHLHRRSSSAASDVWSHVPQRSGF